MEQRQGSFAGAGRGRSPKSGLSKSWRCATMRGCFIALIALVGSLNYYNSLLLLSRPSAKHPDFPIPSRSLQGRRVNSKGGEPCNPRHGHARGSTTEATATVKVKLAICAIVKDEAPYLAEWIEHHKSIGFDFILLYNDGSTDDTQCVMDAYARQGNVTRVPEDTGSRFRKNIPLLKQGKMKIPDNPQQAIFEACRRHLADKELSSGEAGSTWMLTNDVDEFLWFDRRLGSAKNTLLSMLSDLSSWKPGLRSVVIPNCLFGPSGKESFEPGLVMSRFVHRDGNMHCLENENVGETWTMKGKPISQVSSFVKGHTINPHVHRVTNSSSLPWSKDLQKNIFALDDVYAVRPYMRLAHYKTKSRVEFYSRVCSSQYFFKYFNTSHKFNTKMKYPGCCSPRSFFDYMGAQFTHEDKMMLPFAEELESKMSNAAHLCKRSPGNAICPNSVMEVKNWRGLRNMEKYLVNLSSIGDTSKMQSLQMMGKTDTKIKLAICAIVKDEAPYLAEWIEHHKSIGFDFILLYNDKSADDTQCVLDAYARRGDVTRVPEDIGNSYMEDLPWIHEGQIPNNPQQPIFEACRRYLVDEERSSGEAGSTWMLTNDVDEFLWFDRDFGNVMNILATMLLEFSSEQPKSIVVPTCMFGHSGKESFEPEPVMRRFVHRDNNTDCAAKRSEGLWATVGKAFSHVSSIATFTRPEEHVVLGGSILRDVTKVGAYMRLAHYKTKSREEFYSRVCDSRYSFKYFDGEFSQWKTSPEYFFRSFNEEFIHEDNMMLPFAEEVGPKMSSTAAVNCKTEYQALRCPKSLMETKREDGLLRLVQWKLFQEPFKPLVFGAGFGTTATHSMFDATCNLQLRSLHFLIHCGYGNSPEAPLPGLLAHLRVVRAYKALSHCIQSVKRGGVDECPSAKQTLNVMRMHIDRVIESKDVDAIHDAPYPEFAEYVLDAAERIRGVKPIVLLSERTPRDWAKRRQEHKEDLVCKLRMTNSDGLDQYAGQNMYWCLQTAIRSGLGDKSIAIFFDVIKHVDSASEEIRYQLSGGIQIYQDWMKGKAQYVVNLFKRSPRVSSNELAVEIDAAASLNSLVRKSDDHVPPSRQQFPAIGRIKKRGCMPSFGEAFTSGRYCNKLVVFLHFHKAGGTSIIDYLRTPVLWYNLRTNSNPEQLGELQPPNGTDLPAHFDNLRIHSSAKIDSSFWGSLYNRGVDFVNLEYNFATPDVYANMSASVYKLTQLRAPWDRFCSTYERELHLRCTFRKDKEDENKCFGVNSLQSLIMNHTRVMTPEREEEWGGILYPNYYVRMLNGIGDSARDTLLTRDHLEIAKSVLDTFDAVLILEDDDQANLRKIWGLLGDFSKMSEKDGKQRAKAHQRLATMPKLSNNAFKRNPMYEALQKEINAMQPIFNGLNALDLELYEYAQQIISKDFFDLRGINDDDVECNISIKHSSSHHSSSSLQQRHGSGQHQFMIHIHGWPHTGTGYLRQTIQQSLNSRYPGSLSVQNSTLGGGRHYIEDEGQYYQQVYPRFHERRDSIVNWKKNYGKLLYLADTCTINSTATAGDQSKEVGKLLFGQWSKYWDMSATFLLQKTPTLDVVFLERVKVMPTLHLIIVRHPMTFKYMHMRTRKNGIDPNWRPFNWLESWAHVISALAEGKVEWYAVVSYEALVEYNEQVVQELMEVIRSGMIRLGYDETSGNSGLDAFLAGKNTSNTVTRTGKVDPRNNHRRLELHVSDSPASYLTPTKEVTDQWNKCLEELVCNATLNSLSSDILPPLGYCQRDDKMSKLSALPGTVTVSNEYGHVLFSSEGKALQKYRQQQGGVVNDNYIGHQPPPELVTKMAGLLKKLSPKKWVAKAL